MKYKCFGKKNKDSNKGGDYWRETNENNHLDLTPFQTSFKYILKTFSPDTKVLEAGCGLGRWIIPLSKAGFKVTGIEIEKDAVDWINNNYFVENMTVVLGDIFQMPFNDKQYDLVLSLGVMEHFEDQSTLNSALQEHIRILKDDGILFITVPYFNLVRLVFHLPYLKLVSLVRSLKNKKEYFTEYRYGVREFKKILIKRNLVVQKVIWDDLLNPFSFGLTVDYPIKKFTKLSDNEQYKLNGFGLFLQKWLWRIHPALISGGVGFVCKKK